ncbi:origin recognition complex subunit 2-domain-containing protein [Phlyctochytrium arcticum]|nr:origin recognition complex subunit 2-domain-containing protein [Phlyctochytrium arcticum]
MLGGQALEPEGPSTPRRRKRHLKSGLTVSPTRRSAAGAKSGLADDEPDTDLAQLGVFREKAVDETDAASEESDGQGTNGPIQVNTPGKNLYAFPRKRRKKFRGYMDAGFLTGTPIGVVESDGRGEESEDELIAALTATPSKTTERVKSLGLLQVEPMTPTRGKGSRTRTDLPRTPAGKASTPKPETPMPVRVTRKRRAARRLASVAEPSGSEADSDDDDDDDEEEDDEVDEIRQQIPESSSGAQASNMAEDVDMEEDEGISAPIGDDYEEGPSYQRYFADLYDTKIHTSNNTLSKLPPLDPATFRAALATAPQKHNSQISMLQSLHEEQFSQWYFELSQGFNLLFYGYGSKRNLVNKFATETLNDFPLIVVNGFFPSLNIRFILARLREVVFPDQTGPVGTIQDQLDALCEHLRDPTSDKVYLVVHNIDGAPLRNPTAQRFLSVLASLPNFHLVASIDHINAPLLWNSVHTTLYNWVWHDLTTFEPYTHETTSYGSLLMQHSGAGGGRGVALDVRGVVYVLRSLNSNARRVFQILCEHQIAATAEGTGRVEEGDVGLPYHRFYAKAKEAFVVSNELTFRTQLTEFKDHCIIRSHKAKDGTEVLHVPLDASALEGLLEEMGE